MFSAIYYYINIRSTCYILLKQHDQSQAIVHNFGYNYFVKMFYDAEAFPELYCNVFIILIIYHPDKMSQQFSECNCLVSCIQVRYKSKWSFAQLSRTNVDRLVIDTDKERKQLQVHFKHCKLEIPSHCF